MRQTHSRKLTRRWRTANDGDFFRRTSVPEDAERSSSRIVEFGVANAELKSAAGRGLIKLFARNRCAPGGAQYTKVMQPVPWRARTLALSLSSVFSVLFALFCRGLLPTGGHNLPAALFAVAGMYAGLIVFVISTVRLALHALRWVRAGRPKPPF